ncbi:MAG TPA: hypothetical protein VES91_03200 [Burkholderiaceae bacterium]|nr:hypothetical protein [Burkholderiaceae bacterium]
MTFAYRSSRKTLTRRLIALFAGLWLAATVLPCAMADTGCAMPDEEKPCALSAAEGCDAATVNCALPDSTPGKISLDIPTPIFAAITVAPTMFPQDPAPPRQWQRAGLRLPPTNLHLQTVRLLI